MIAIWFGHGPEPLKIRPWETWEWQAYFCRFGELSDCYVGSPEPLFLPKKSANFISLILNSWSHHWTTGTWFGRQFESKTAASTKRISSSLQDTEGSCIFFGYSILDYFESYRLNPICRWPHWQIRRQDLSLDATHQFWSEVLRIISRWTCAYVYRYNIYIYKYPQQE